MKGSICLSKLGDAYKAKHSAFSVSEKNGQIYANISVWLNDEPDAYGNILSFQLNSAQGTTDEKVYFGNAKLPEATTAKPAETVKDKSDDIPF